MKKPYNFTFKKNKLCCFKPWFSPNFQSLFWFHYIKLTIDVKKQTTYTNGLYFCFFGSFIDPSGDSQKVVCSCIQGYNRLDGISAICTKPTMPNGRFPLSVGQQR